MYKINDIVETRLGIGEVIAVTSDWVTVDILDYKVTMWHLDIKPYKSAHEKLIEMGYEEKIHDVHVKSDGYKQYANGSEVILIDVEGREFTTYTLYSGDRRVSDVSWVNHKLSCILTQYLEELEND